MVVKSEFPEFEAMAAFSALHLTKGQHINAAMVGNQLAHLAHLAQVSEHELASQFDKHINRALFHVAEGKSTTDAWRLALGRGCNDGALRAVVMRLIAFSCSTSGVEQLFAKIHATVRPQRGNLDDGHTRDEYAIVGNGKMQRMLDLIIEIAQDLLPLKRKTILHIQQEKWH